MMNALVALLHHPDTERLGWVLLHFLWQGFAVAILLRAAHRLLRHAPANTRYMTACAAMLLLAALPAVTLMMLPRPTTPLAMVGATGEAMPQPLQATRNVPAQHQGISVVSTGSFVEQVRPMLPILVMIWFTGVLVFSIYHIAGWLYLHHLRHGTHPMEAAWQARISHLASRAGLRRPILLLESALVRVPTALGWLRPVILVPASALASLTPQQLDALLLHELAHIRRHDYLVNLVQVAIETLLFYHPATWWISRQIRQERENCCDDTAADLCGDRLLYAQSLASMEELRGLGGEFALAASGGKLLTRIHRLLATPAAEGRPRAWSLGAALAVVAAVVLPLIAVQLDAADNKPQVQSLTTRPATSPITPEDLTAIPVDYVIGPNDLITVRFFDQKAEEMRFSIRVSETGMISLYSLKEPIRVDGLTEPELQQVIEQRYRNTGIDPNPQVSVIVTEARARMFTIIGAVTKPGRYPMMTADFRLTDALASAGGLKGKPEKIYVVRSKATEKRKEPAQRVLEIPAKELLSANLRYNVVIRPSDTIIISPDDEAEPTPAHPAQDDKGTSR